DMDPDHEGLEVWEVHEDASATYGYELHDAKTGTILWGTYVGSDNGRGLAADIDANYPGFEMWSTGGTGTYSCKGVQISTKRPSVNFRIYWDGDLQDELLDGTSITKWTGNGTTTLLSTSGVSSCNGTKATPNLSADILGDWREEAILWTTSDSSSLRIYTTTTPTSYRLFTLMHDPVYRLGVAWQNVAYNQPPHLGFYIGGGLSNVQQPNITTVKYNTTTAVKSLAAKQTLIYSYNGTLKVNSSKMIQSVSVYSILGRLVYQNNTVDNQEFTCQLPGNDPLYIVKVKTNSGIQTAKVHY
ncbi:MAG TPA: T9SS type A sorting domain-containing protein, partial [Bacteroidales bacterium]